jgi:hypothetical protein
LNRFAFDRKPTEFEIKDERTVERIITELENNSELQLTYTGCARDPDLHRQKY